jgi:outer membrane protein
LKQKLDEILRKIGEERGFAFILNTDNNNAPWLNPAMGEDITEAVKALLQ